MSSIETDNITSRSGWEGKNVKAGLRAQAITHLKGGEMG